MVPASGTSISESDWVPAVCRNLDMAGVKVRDESGWLDAGLNRPVKKHHSRNIRIEIRKT